MYQKTFALTVRALRVDARNLSPHLMRAGLAFVVLLTLLSASEDLGAAAPGRDLFGWIIYTNIVFATLVVPMLFATAITEEKEERTLALLQIANVTPLTILVGKALPRLVSVFLIFIIQIPFSLLAITLGGITLTQVAAAYFAVGAYIVFAALLALWCSVIFRLTANSMGLAGIMLLAYHLLPLVVWGVCLSLSTIPNAAPWTNPIQSFLDNYYWESTIFTRIPDILASGYSGGVLTSTPSEFVSTQLWTNLVYGVGFFFLSWSTFQYFNRETDSSPTKRKSKAAVKRSHQRRAWNMAVSWKEFYFSTGGTTFVVLKFFLYGALILLIGFAFAEWDARRLDIRQMAGAAGFMMLFLFLPLEIIFSVAKIFYPEVKEQTLSTLLLLPFSTRQIAYSKLVGIIPSLIPCFVYLLFSLAFHLDSLDEFATQWARRPTETLLVYFNMAAHFVLFLHIVVFLSLRMNSWWAVFVAGIIHYFGIAIPTVLFSLILAVTGVMTDDSLWYFVWFLIGIAAFAGAGGLHYWIGRQLEEKAAEL